MDLNSMIESASNFWAGILPDGASCTDRKKTEPEKIEILDSALLEAEPRSIESSELTEKSSLNISDPLKWTAEDDSKLIDLIQKYNYDWKIISKCFDNHSLPSIKARWEYLTKKNLKSFIWRNEDDQKILRLYSVYNGCWNKICEFFPGRTKAALKNRYYGVLKKRCSSVKETSNLVDIKTADTLPDESRKSIRFCSPEAQSINLEKLTPDQKREQISKLYNKMMLLKEKLGKAQEKITKIQLTKK